MALNGKRGQKHPRVRVQGIATSWERVADWYDDLLEGSDDTYQRQVILPNLLRLVAPRGGLRVLDVACGQGFFSRAFAEAGAEVVGVDISEELVRRARERAPAGVKFIVASADRIPLAEKGVFDAATIVLALQNIENVAGVFGECARLLRQGGKLFLVLNHPCFRIPKHSSWGFDAAAGLQYRRLDSYLSESRATIEMHPGQTVPALTASFHRPLQLYFKALGKAGFSVTRLEEWTSQKKSETGPRAAAENKARREFPLFLFLEAVRG
ncbi:MAG: putative methyltransferase [Parcubacteria group bacterium Gr01-1014_72]|nr:MAG: putative methyltransferase [Parcubacteria group bacterium Gr01-1014_72]